MSALSEYLKQFKTQEELLTVEGLDSFLLALNRGCLLRNDEKMRVEFCQIKPNSGEPMVLAWIDYGALRENPKMVMEYFIEYKIRKPFLAQHVL